MSEATIALIGFSAATLTTAAFIPQAVQTFKTRHTKDISLGMYLTITIGVFLWLVYGVMLNSAPIYLANGVTLIFASMILYLKLKHG